MRFTLNAEQWKNKLRHQSTERLQQRLKDEIETIKFLESIYMTGAPNNCYCSQQLIDEAYKDTQSLYQLTSALHSLLAERE